MEKVTSSKLLYGPLKSSKVPPLHLWPSLLKTAVIRRFHDRPYLLVALALLIIFLPLALLLTLKPRSTQAAWFDDSYAYRQEIPFTHNADITSDRAVTFSLDTAELITAGVMQSDCDDTRFTDINGKVLRYQLTGTCNNAATTYEVVFPKIFNSSNLGYVYYGNPSASSASEDVSATTALTPSGGDPAITTRTNEEKGTGPILLLRIDEGYGTSTSDSSSSNTDGSISGATWQTEDLCASGKCLKFDGTDDVVTVTNANSIDFDTGLSGGVTFSGWVRVNSDGESNVGEIYDKGANTYLRITNDGTDGLADLEAKLDLGTTDATATVTNGITLNRWHHVAFGYTDDGDDEITVYIDGLLRATSTDGVGAPATTDTNNLLLGGDTLANYDGLIDEFKVYNYERTAAQVRGDFSGLGSSESVAQAFSPNQKFISDGLAGYWKMDEASGNRSDSSGNALTLTDNATVTSNPGKFDDAGQFTAATFEYLSITDNATLSTGDVDFTATAWVYLDSLGVSRIISGKSDDSTHIEWRMRVTSSNVLAFATFDSGGNVVGTVTTTDTLTTGTWYFAVGWHDATNDKIGIQLNNGTPAINATTGSPSDTTASFRIGAQSSTPADFWNG